MTGESVILTLTVHYTGLDFWLCSPDGVGLHSRELKHEDAELLGDEKPEYHKIGFEYMFRVSQKRAKKLKWID